MVLAASYDNANPDDNDFAGGYMGWGSSERPEIFPQTFSRPKEADSIGMKLSRITELLGRPAGREIRSGKKKGGYSLLVWMCYEGPTCEPICTARNPVPLDMSTSNVPDKGLWTIEPCGRHAALFKEEMD